MVKFLPPQGQIQPIQAFSALSSDLCGQLDNEHSCLRLLLGLALDSCPTYRTPSTTQSMHAENNHNIKYDDPCDDHHQQQRRRRQWKQQRQWYRQYRNSRTQHAARSMQLSAINLDITIFTCNTCKNLHIPQATQARPPKTA